MRFEFIASGSKADLAAQLKDAVKAGSLSKATAALVAEQLAEVELADANDLSIMLYGDDTWGPGREAGQFALHMDFTFTERPVEAADSE